MPARARASCCSTSTSKAAAEAAKEIRDAGGKAESFTLDVTKREDCIAVAKEIADKVGQVSILVNNAGINRRNAFTADADAVLKDWQDIMAINLNGVFNVTHAFLEPLRASKGRIVNIGSIQSFVHVRTPNSPAYTTSKHGVLGFTKALAAELGKHGVRVNAIGPGLIETPLNAQVRANNPELVKIFIDHTPLGRAGKPEDIVGPAIFLASDLVGLCHRLDRDGRRRLPDDLRQPCPTPRITTSTSPRSGPIPIRIWRGCGRRRRSPSCRSSARPCFTRRDDIFSQEKRIDVFSSHQPAGLMNALMGHNMMRKDGDAHMSERAQMFPAVSPRVVKDTWRAQFQAHADRILEELAPQGRADLVQGVRAAAVGGMPEGHHRAHQHALSGHGCVVAGDDRRHRQLHRQQGGRGALPCRDRRHRCRDRRHDPGGVETSRTPRSSACCSPPASRWKASAPTSSLRSRADRTSRAMRSRARCGRC